MNRTQTGYYYARLAHNQAQEKRQKANGLRSKRYNQRLVSHIYSRILEKYSPEQIVGELKLKYSKDKELRVSTETVYQILYFLAKDNKIDLRCYLRNKKQNKRKKRQYRDKSAMNAKKKSIHDRPISIVRKLHFGHWEGDLIEGKKGTGFIMTFVDRKSRYTIAGKLSNKTADHFNDIARCIFSDFEKIKSITYDNGVEMSNFENLEEILHCKIYFCDPGKPRQRGLNENINGLLRQYFKKGSDFSVITQKDIDQVIVELNNRPRKCLNFRTPTKVFPKTMILAS